MRVLLLSPYGPHLAHRHAAADTLARLVPLLAARTELYVYSPQNGPAPVSAGAGYTLLPSGPVPPRPVRDRLGPRPAWLRQAWPARATREAIEAAHRLRPDVVHAEYLQSGEVTTHLRHTVLGLHDITTAVMAESLRAASGTQWLYRLAELARTRRFERAAIRRAAVVVTLSDADRAAATRHNPRTLLARPGVDVPPGQWTRPARTPPRVVFTGAMWRRANVHAARFLAGAVMPVVWRDLPDTQLRIVGADPTDEVWALGAADRRVTVTGEVPDLAVELLAAHAVAAPTIVGGGVLMKVLRAMALGCPVVTTAGAAAGVAGGADNLFVADDRDGFAAAVRTALCRPDEAARRGAAARAHVAAGFGWDATVRRYLDAYAIAGQR